MEENKPKIKKEDLVEWFCERCGKHICWVCDFDMNSNYLYCDECVINGNSNPPKKKD